MQIEEDLLSQEMAYLNDDLLSPENPCKIILPLI